MRPHSEQRRGRGVPIRKRIPASSDGKRVPDHPSIFLALQMDSIEPKKRKFAV
jgi:hypothetical protein